MAELPQNTFWQDLRSPRKEQSYLKHHQKERRGADSVGTNRAMVPPSLTSVPPSLTLVPKLHVTTNPNHQTPLLPAWAAGPKREIWAFVAYLNGFHYSNCSNYLNCSSWV